MRIGVVGAGAVGGYCAAQLIRAGHDVHIVEVGPHLAAMQSRGLRVQTPSDECLVHPHATAEPADVGTVDLVIVAVQSQDTAGVAGKLRPLLGKQTLVVPFQNNVDNPDLLAAALGSDHVLAAAIFIASSRPEFGLIRQLAEQVKVTLGERDGRESDRTQDLARLFNAANLPCAASSQVRKEMWAKFAFVVGFYLTAPLRSSAGEVLDLDETRLLHRRLIGEVAAVAATRGITIGDDDLAEVVQTTRHYGNYVPSVVQEIDEGRADEAVHMLRTVIQMGRAHHVLTPMAEATLAFTTFFNQRNKRRT